MQPRAHAVLVVEDESIVALDIQQTLAGLGYDPFAVASSAEEALARASERCPDVVLMDIRIKGDLDGVSTARLLQERFSVPVVYVTAHADGATIERAKLARPQGYVLKPVRAAELKSAIEIALLTHEINERLRESERRYRDLIDNSMGFIITHDAEGVVHSINPAGARAIGYEPGEIVGRKVADFVPERLRPQLDEYLERIRADGRASGLLTVVARDGQERILAFQNVAIEAKGRPTHVLCHAEDVTEHILLQGQLREQSLRDPLTGCHNRRYLDEFEKAAGPGGRWGCLFVDIDHFKQYNESHGHKAGDEVLVRMARFLSRGIRADETVVRMGGDEFVVLLGRADADSTRTVVERIRAEGPRFAPARFTLGWAARKAGEPLERTIGRADHAMFAVRAIQRGFKKRRRVLAG